MISFVNTIRASVRALCLIALLAIFVISYLISLGFSKHTVERAFRLRRNWVKLAIRILGIHIITSGEIPTQTALYISNHRSFTDPVIVANYVDAFIIAKAEVESMPLISKGAELTGVIYVQREDKDSRRATREALVATLEGGYNVLVYPEGTVNAKQTTMRFKTGTFNEAAKLGIPIIPIAIEYSKASDRWENRTLFQQYFRQYGKARTYVKLNFGPILSDESSELLVSRTKQFIDESLTEMQSGWSERYS